MSAYLEDDDKKYKKFKKKINFTKDLEVAVGIHEDAGFKRKGKYITSILDYAIWNHFGTENIPKRPFIDITTDKHKGWQKEIDLAMSNFIDNDVNLFDEANKVGKLATKDMQAVIENKEVPPPNKLSTIKRKGFDHPLIETKTLLKSIKHKTKEL